MFAIPGILALVAFIYVRPQEFIEGLRSFPFLYIFLGLTVFGLAVDLRQRLLKPQVAPQLGYVIAFLLWSLLSLAVRGTEDFAPGFQLVIAAVLYLVVSHGVQSFKGFQTVALGVLACATLIAVVTVHEGSASYQCIEVDEHSTDFTSGKPDGRPCTERASCSGGENDISDWLCERVGLLGLSSVGHGRIRYVGTLQDPNELALVVGVALPFAIAWAQRRRTLLRRTALAVVFVLVTACTIMSKSRGGVLVYVAVLGTYFVQRFGRRGAFVGALVALPLVILGGRSGSEASASSIERLECWYAAVHMVRDHPLLGVGLGKFVEHHILTAHNSYLLAPAELGLPGMALWTLLIYISVKIPIAGLRRFATRPEAEVARVWGMALLSSMCGLLVGVLFLSFCYHHVLWIYLGLCGAYYSAAKAHDPEWVVSLDWREVAGVLAFDLALLVVLGVYTQIKVG
jgi:hypothetical protein